MDQEGMLDEPRIRHGNERHVSIKACGLVRCFVTHYIVQSISLESRLATATDKEMNNREGFLSLEYLK